MNPEKLTEVLNTEIRNYSDKRLGLRWAGEDEEGGDRIITMELEGEAMGKEFLRRQIRWCCPPDNRAEDENGREWIFPLIAYRIDGRGKLSGFRKRDPLDLENATLVYTWWDQALRAARRLGIAGKAENAEKGQPWLLSEVLIFEGALNNPWAGESALRKLRAQRLDSGREPLLELEASRMVEVDTAGDDARVEGRHRLPHHSQRYLLCPFQTPESKKIGLQLFLAAGSEFDHRNCRLEAAGGSPIFSAAVGLVPYPAHTDGPRLMMGGKNLKQAVRVKKAEPPMVPGHLERDSGDSYKFFGGTFEEARFSPAPGVNALVAVMPWGGFTYEDGLVVSSGLARRLEISGDRLSQRAVFDINPEALKKEALELTGGGSKPEEGDDGEDESGGEPAIEMFELLGTLCEGFQRSCDSAARQKLLYRFGCQLHVPDGMHRILREFSAPLYEFHAPGILDSLRIRWTADWMRGYSGTAPRLEMKFGFRVDRPLTIGDKLTGRSGNKGVVARILEPEELPIVLIGGKEYPVDLMISPCSIIGRKNLGQIYEMAHGLVLQAQEDELLPGSLPGDCPLTASEFRKEVFPALKEMGMDEAGFPVRFPDPETGEPRETRAFAGWQYICRLAHHAPDKLQARGESGPDVAAMGQPRAGGAWAGQRIGEMENWTILSRGQGLGPAGDSIDLLRALRTGRAGGKGSGGEDWTFRTAADLMELAGMGIERSERGARFRSFRKQGPPLSARLAREMLDYIYREEHFAGKLKRAENSLNKMLKEKPDSEELEEKRRALEGLNKDREEMEAARKEFRVLSFTDLERERERAPEEDLLPRLREWLPRLANSLSEASEPGNRKLLEFLEALSPCRVEDSPRSDLLELLKEIIPRGKTGPADEEGDKLPEAPPDLVENIDDDEPDEDEEEEEEGGKFPGTGNADAHGKEPSGAARRRAYGLRALACLFCEEKPPKLSARANFAGGIPFYFPAFRAVPGLAYSLSRALADMDNFLRKPSEKNLGNFLYRLNKYWKDLFKYLAGKRGIFVGHLLGHRVRHSGRAVIVPGPDLALDTVRLPARMLVQLLEGHGALPKLGLLPHDLDRIRDLSLGGRKEAGKAARELNESIRALDDGLWCLLLRQPTLHRHSIQAFRVECWEELAVAIPPMLTPGFNADFDGDTMAVFLPPPPWCHGLSSCSIAASPGRVGDGAPQISASLDLALGWSALADERRKFWEDLAEAESGATLEQVRDCLIRRAAKNGGWLRNLGEMQREVCAASTGAASISPTELERLYRELAPFRESVADPGPDRKEEDYKEMEKRADRAVEKWLEDNPKTHLHRLVSGRARGEPADLRKICGFTGLAKDNYTISEPAERELADCWISGCFWGGLEEDELFRYSYAARESMAMKKLSTARAGWLSWKLAEGLYNTVIGGEDCGADRGISLYRRPGGAIEARIPGDDGSGADPFPLTGTAESILQRAAWGRVPVGESLPLDRAECRRRYRQTEEGGGEPFLVIRSPLTCRQAGANVCSACAGSDPGLKPLDTPRLQPPGSPVGLTAAQAIGERGTQLAMQRFHDVSGSRSSPVERLENLLLRASRGKGNGSGRKPSSGELFRFLAEEILSRPGEGGSRIPYKDLPQDLVHYELALRTSGGLKERFPSWDGNLLAAAAFASITRSLAPGLWEGGEENARGLKSAVMLNVRPEEER